MAGIIVAACGPGVYDVALTGMAVFQTVALAYVAARWAGVPKAGG